MTNVAAVVIAGIIPELQSHSFLNHVKININENFLLSVLSLFYWEYPNNDM